MKYTERYRPQYHYSPAKNWMNDPNGLVFYEGEYHLFYQHTPTSTQPNFNRMHWGHAVSKDLIHWEELPPAVFPDEDGAIFSGSAVADLNNTSGFFNETGSGLVAIFTIHNEQAPDGKPQSQGIAYSKDNGRTWIKYEGNPVLRPNATADFRDPKVIWHNEAEKWIMALAVQDRVEFYSSPNLIHWSFESSFGSDVIGTHRGVYECPDLFPIEVDGEPDQLKWVLLLSVGDNNGVNPLDPETPGTGSGMLYFVGSFDGNQFKPDTAIQSINDLRWLDYGADFYAAVTWDNAPTPRNQKLCIGWMNNWRYAGAIPTDPWRGCMSVPRVLKLKRFSSELKLIQEPVKALNLLRSEVVTQDQLNIDSESHLLTGVTLTSGEIIADFELGSATQFGIRLRKSAQEATTLGVDVSSETIYLDRTNSGQTDFHPSFSIKHCAPLSLQESKKLLLRVLIDHSSVEVFINGGQIVFTDLIFPSDNSHELELFSSDGSVTVISLQINKLNSVWESTIALI